MNQSIAVDLGYVVEAVANAGLYTSICDIYSTSQEPDAIGQVNLSTLIPREGLQGIPCMNAPANLGANAGHQYTERNPETIPTYNLRHVSLKGYYPAIEQKNVAMIDGVPYEIRNAESDSQKTYTRLALRVYSL